MRRFIVTSTKFTGTAELIYNDNGTICLIDLRNAEMDEMTAYHFKSAVNASERKLASGFGKDTIIVQSDFELTFETFWKDYPLHRNRFMVEKFWGKMNRTEQIKAFHSLHAYKKYITKNSWYTAMIADRYLRNKEYETDWNKM